MTVTFTRTDRRGSLLIFSWWKGACKHSYYYTHRNYIIQIRPDLKKNLYREPTPSVSVVSTLIPVVFRIQMECYSQNSALVYAKNYAAQPGLNEIPPAKKVSNEIFKYILI